MSVTVSVRERGGEKKQEGNGEEPKKKKVRRLG